MRIEKLHIEAFGKFRDFTLDFSEGINLIYGLNESGKSTIHAFIEAMFYGFIDPTKKKKTYIKAAHERFQPKDTNAYGGTLIFTFDDTRYRIERSLRKRKDYLKLYNDATGRELTDTIDKDSVTRQADLARFIDMPYPLYKNTLSVAQLEARTTKDATDDLIRRLQNLKETSTETLSTAKAKAALQAKLDAIGTERAPTKPYAKALGEETDLKAELEQAREQHIEAQHIQKTIDETEEKSTILTKERENLTKRVTQQENTRRKETYETIRNNLLMTQRLLEKHSDNPPRLTHAFLDKSLSDYDKEFNRIESDREEYLRAHDRIETLREQKSDKTIDEATYAAIEEDAERIETFQSMIKRDTLEAKRQVYLKKTAALENEEKKHLEKRRYLTVLKPVLVLLVVMTAVLFFFTTGFYVLTGVFALITLVFIGIYLLSLKRSKETIETLRKETETRKKEIGRIEKGNEEARKEIDRILKNHDTETLEAFNRKRYEAKYLYENRKKNQETDKRIADEQATIDTVKTKLKPLLSRFGLTFSTAALDALRKMKTTAGEIDRLLGESTFKDFERSIDFTLPDTADDDYEANRARLLEIEATLQELRSAIETKNAELRYEEGRYRNIATIEYDLLQVKDRIGVYEAKQRRLKDAIERIARATDRIEENFAPLLSNNIETYLRKLTLDAYSDIKVRRDLSFNLFSRLTRQLEGEYFFSTGTLDQIYFSLRLGILKTLGKNTYPLFLDDAFVNFDDERLKEALTLLDELKAERQIILFTCQHREKEALDEKSIRHRKLTLPT